jgi:hypothetical protein
MTNVEHGKYLDMACAWISNGQIKLAITTSRGPRAMFLGWQNGPNLFAEILDVTIPSANGPYELLGGHRLWHAPEWSLRTYWPETQPITVIEKADGVKVTLSNDGAMIEKSLEFTMDSTKPVVKVVHSLTNNVLWPVELAPWAITQCRLGGTVLLPQPVDPADAENLLPNKRYSFWPYTNFADGRFEFGNQITLLRAKVAPSTKLGYRNHHGWAGYWLDGTLFVKRFDPQLGANHPDYGCNCECYCNDRFVEVETLGALVTLAPGATATHTETWQLYKDVPSPVDEATAIAIAKTL